MLKNIGKQVRLRMYPVLFQTGRPPHLICPDRDTTRQLKTVHPVITPGWKQKRIYIYRLFPAARMASQPERKKVAQSLLLLGIKPEENRYFSTLN